MQHAVLLIHDAFFNHRRHLQLLLSPLSHNAGVAPRRFLSHLCDLSRMGMKNQSAWAGSAVRAPLLSRRWVNRMCRGRSMRRVLPLHGQVAGVQGAVSVLPGSPAHPTALLSRGSATRSCSCARHALQMCATNPPALHNKLAGLIEFNPVPYHELNSGGSS
jgi:hypothetical protein